MAISDWSTDPASNGAILFAENQSPSSVNNNARQMMADIAAAYQGTAPITSGFARTAAEILAGVTPTNYAIPSHVACGYFLPERYGNNTTPGTTDMATALDNAQLVAVAAGGGTILLTNTYKRTTSWSCSELVNIVGTGYAVGIEFGDVDGFLFDYVLGFGQPTLSNFFVNGSGTTRRAFYQAGTTDVGDEIYGLTLRNVLVTNFNVAAKFRSVRNLTIEHCWFQDVNSGIDLTGAAIHARIVGNDIVKASGNGTGNSYGVLLASHTFPVGGAFVPEGVVIDGNNLIYGFDVDVKATAANFVDLVDNDLQALVHCVEFDSVNEVFNIERNYLLASSATALAAIKGNGQGSVIPTKTNIRGNNLIASSTTSCIGVQINDSGNQNQNYVHIDDNRFSDFDTNDILLNNAGHCSVINNRCDSSDPTNSISVTAVLAGMVYIDRNQCAKAIAWDAAEAAAGEVVLGNNWINGTTRLVGSQQVPTVASVAAVTLPLGSKAHEHFIISGTTNITSIVATGWTGRTVTLVFQDVLTFTDGSNLKLAGNLVTSADDTITLFCDGTNWFETGRSVN